MFCNEVKSRFETDIMELRTDGGKEYVNQDVKCFLNKRGIKHTTVAPYTPEQNGSAERENRILMEAARSMIYGKPHIPQFLLAEAINTAAFVLNRTESTKFKGKSPYELWFEKKPRMDYLKVFGTECFVHVPKEKRRKLDKKAVKGLFVGYHDKVDGYRVWVPEKHDVIISHDDSEMWFDAMFFLSELTTKFEAKITENVTNFLGIQIQRNNNNHIMINQAMYIEKVLKRFGMSEAKPVSTPMEIGWTAENSPSLDAAIPYREIVGNLMYLR